MPKSLTVLAMLSLAALTACGSAPAPSTQADATRFSDSSMTFTSRRSPSSIAGCLTSRIGGVRRSTGGATTSLTIGDGPAWRITLTPAGHGTTVNVLKASGGGSPVDEPQMRFSIARCTT